MSHIQDNPTPSSTPTPKPPRRRRTRPYRLPRFNLSATSLVATGLAAITATFAASYLGVAGTVIGAALFSVLTSVGKEVYDQSLRRTGNAVREVGPVTRVLPRPPDASRANVAPTEEQPPVLPASVPASVLRSGE